MSLMLPIRAPIDVQRRFVELGRIRMGFKAEFQRDGHTRTRPAKLDVFRLTSASRPLLEGAAEIYGGEVREWKDAPDQGFYELTTASASLDIMLPPGMDSYSQAYELWDAGGCARRCDGTIEKLSGEPCQCDPAARLCKITTRVSVLLPKVRGLGVWRLDTHGWNAASTLPTTIALVKAMAPDAWIPAVLTAVAQSKKVRVDADGKRIRTGGKVETRRWVEPRIDLVDVTMEQIMGGQQLPGMVVRAALPAGSDRKVERPALPAGPAPTAEPFRGERAPGFGNAPAIEARPIQPDTAAGASAVQGEGDGKADQPRSAASTDAGGMAPVGDRAAAPLTRVSDVADDGPEMVPIGDEAAAQAAEGGAEVLGSLGATPPDGVSRICGADPGSSLGMTEPCQMTPGHSGRTHRSKEGTWPIAPSKEA